MSTKQTAAKAIRSVIDMMPLPTIRIAVPALSVESPLAQPVQMDKPAMDELLETYRQDLKDLLASSRRTSTGRPISLVKMSARSVQ